MSRISENIRKITRAWGGKTTGNGIGDAVRDLAENLPFGTKTEIVEILPEQSVMQIDEEGQLLYLIKDGFTIEDGKEYKAVVDGVSYDVIGMSESGIYAVTDTGDLDAATLYFICDSSGVAFPIPEGYGSVAMFPNGTANTRVAIYEEQKIVTPLPAKFMPEPIVFTTADMQTVTCNKSFDECLEAFKNHSVPIIQMGTDDNEYYTFSQMSYSDNGTESYISCALLVTGSVVIVEWSKFTGLLEISVTTE